VFILLLVGLGVYAYRESEAYCNCSGMGVSFNRPANTFWRGAWPASFSALPLNFTSAYGTYPRGCGSADFGWPQSSDQPFARDRFNYASTQPYGIGSNEVRDFMRDARDGLLNNASVQYSFGQTPIALANPTMVARNMMLNNAAANGGGAAMLNNTTMMNAMLMNSANANNNDMMFNGVSGVQPSVYGPSTVMQLSNAPMAAPVAGAGPVRQMMMPPMSTAAMSQAAGGCAVNLPTFTGGDCCACGPTTSTRNATPRFVPLTAIPGAQLPPGAVTDSVPCAEAAAARLRFGDGRWSDVQYGNGRYNNISVGVL
jgi:hypothetical protein